MEEEGDDVDCEIHSISQDAFERLPELERTGLFETQHIHLFPSNRDPASPFHSPRGFQTSREALAFLHVDMGLTRTVYGECWPALHEASFSRSVV